MGMPMLRRRLLLVLTALAFVLATALPGTASAMPMTPGGSVMAGDFGHQPCGDCPTKVPASDSGTKMMPCSALACSGAVVGLPAPTVLGEPIAVALEYTARVPTSHRGRTLPPDPFPPRPSLLV
jgi:hypothetical protein